MPEASEGLFRQEALRHHERGGEMGTLLRLTPRWARWSFPLVAGAAAFYLLFGVLGRVSTYASGPAAVRVEDRFELTALAAGRVDSVEVRPGQRVAQGQVLARFSDEAERAELERLEREFELHLAQRMRDLTDEGARQALGSLRVQKELAEARWEQRQVRAPRSGVVGDVRLRPGQHVAQGEVMVSLLGTTSPVVVTAALPGEYRPLLEAGAVLRLELKGFPYRYQELIVEDVADELVGPEEVRRYLGLSTLQGLDPGAATVLVRARLPARSFEMEGRRLAYFDGMPGRAQVRLRSEPLLVALVPGLKALLP